MDSDDFILPLGISFLFVLLFGTLIVLDIFSPAKIVDNKTVVGIFEKIEINKQDVTIYFKDYSSITYWQRRDDSQQVPLVVGHTYQFILAKHNGDYYTLQSVVEIPT